MRILHTRARVVQNNLLVRLDPAGLHEFDERRVGGRSFRRAEYPGQARDDPLRVKDIVVRNGDSSPVCLPQGTQDQAIPAHGGNTQPAGDGAGVLPDLRTIGSLLESTDNRRAAFGLHRYKPGTVAVDPA